jgi:hypothetical protein
MVMNVKQAGLACAALLCFSGAVQATEQQAMPEAAAVQPNSSEPMEKLPGMESLEIEAAAASRRERSAQRQQQIQAAPGSKIDLAPLPVTIYLMNNQKPTVAFTTPCIMIERMTNGFPPVLAFENFMFEVIGNVNESGLLPITIEPVCI